MDNIVEDCPRGPLAFILEFIRRITGRPRTLVRPRTEYIDWNKVMISADLGTYLYRDDKQNCHWAWQDEKWKHTVYEFEGWGP